MKRVNSYDPDARLPGVGGIYVWELDAPQARELIEVVKVFWNGEEWWVETRTLLPNWTYPRIGGPTSLNDVSRFWEAVTPVRETRTRRPPLTAPEE